MAADVTLFALPASEENWRRARLQCWDEQFPDDEVLRDEDGEIWAYGGGETRSAFQNNIFRDADWIEIGPLSWLKASLSGSDEYLPAPTVAVHDYWKSATLVSPARIKCTTTWCMNLPDRSLYRKWRKANRRQVKRWLNAHLGDIVWAETW